MGFKSNKNVSENFRAFFSRFEHDFDSIWMKMNSWTVLVNNNNKKKKKERERKRNKSKINLLSFNCITMQQCVWIEAWWTEYCVFQT